MCGIFGYIGKRDVIKTALDGIKLLEYRGYDSAGLAAVQNNNIHICKEVGKVAALEAQVNSFSWENVSAAICQTRWATHGQVTKENAHPHFDKDRSLAVVHNGIIENHEMLRSELKEKGYEFISNTDTEVIAHLIASCYEGNLLDAVQKSVARLQGAYAVVLVHRDYPDQMIAIAHEAPLVIGIGSHEAFISSDPNAFASYTKQAIYLSNSEIAVVKTDSQQIYAAEEAIDKEMHILDHNVNEMSKGEYEHYTLKEIYEQPQTIRNAFFSRVDADYGTAFFENLAYSDSDLLAIERILILACGTSWHAAYVASYIIEELARIPVQVEISSEFRYKNPIVPSGTFVIAISQSGETADTLLAVREVKAKGAKVLSVCNVHGSTLTREADDTIYLKAGAEVGVCSTKAFTSQMTILSLFALKLARMRNMSKSDGQRFLEELIILPEKVQLVLNQAPTIEAIARKYAQYENFFYIGRSYMYPTSLEGALKLKEISYINANGYAGGELKHGPIALISEACPTVALCANQLTYDKLFNNLMEIKTRHGKIIAIANKKDELLEKTVDDVIYVPATCDELAVIPVSVVNQLFAYYIARFRGADIDQPRNLAKSVTVE